MIPAQQMVEARKALVSVLVGPTNGGNARLLAPVIIAAIVAGQIPHVSFSFKNGGAK